MVVCDICGAPGTGTMVSAEQIREAVFLKGFNPFKLGLTSSMADLNLNDDESFIYWKNNTVSQDTSDWNVCFKCMEKLRLYLSGDPEPTGVRKAKISLDPAAGMAAGAAVEQKYKREGMVDGPLERKSVSGRSQAAKGRVSFFIFVFIIVLGVLGAGFYLYKKGVTPEDAWRKVQTVVSQKAAGILKKHPSKKMVVTKHMVKRPFINWEELFSYVPIDPGHTYVVAAADLEGFIDSMGKRLSFKDRVAAKIMALKSGVAVAWPKKEGAVSSKDMHYAVVCSVKGNMVEIKKKLFENSGMEIIEGTCGVGTDCYQVAVKKAFSYLAFKGGKYIMVSDDPDILDVMAREKPSVVRGRKWHSILHVNREWLGAFLVRAEYTPKMMFPPSFTPSQDVTVESPLEYVSIAGHIMQIAKGFKSKLRITPRLKNGEKIEVAAVQGRWDISPRLPSDAIVWGMDLDALRKSVEPTVKKLNKSGKGNLDNFKGKIFSEVGFSGQKPLFYLKGSGLNEESPILARLGKPGNEIDVTKMSPVIAMILGKTTLVRKKGGFIATNIPDLEAFRTSSKELDDTRELMSGVLDSQPIGFVCIAPVRLAKGAALLLKPFFSQNAEFSKSMQKLEEADQNPAYAKRVVVLVRSPLSYEVKVEFE